MDDRARVAAIRAGDPTGLASTYDAYGNALFAFCHSMLHDRAAAEDAVQDTFVLVAERVGQLRDPDRLRPWLYAVARTQCLHQLRAARRVQPVDELADDLMSETVDFESGVHRDALHALVWQAMGGLNTGERAALELSLRHGLDGDDLAAALGVTRSHATKLLQRARSELERGLGALVVARENATRCAELGQIVAGWDGVLTVLMRKRLARHIDGCADCGQQKQQRVSAAALLAAIPLLAAPAALRETVLRPPPTKLVSDDVALGPTTADPGIGGRPQRSTAAVVRSAGWFDTAGFPNERTPQRRRIGALIAAISAAVLAIVLLSVHAPAHPSGPFQSTAGSDSPTASRPGTTAIATTPTATTPTTAKATPTTTAPSTQSVTPTTTPPTTPTTPAPTSPNPTTTPPTTPTVPTTPPKTTPTTPKPPPVAPTLAAALTPAKYPAGTGGSGVLTLTTTGGPIDWTATASGGVTLSPSSGTITPDGTDHAKVLVPPGKSGGFATVTVSWDGTTTTVTLTWS